LHEAFVILQQPRENCKNAIVGHQDIFGNFQEAIAGILLIGLL
jgi:hypothetical protein